jgi:hypothetical protein
MPDNINAAPAPVKLDAVLSDAEFRAEIEAVARQIEHFERSAIFRIANRLAWVHEQFLYRRDKGGFQGWVESRLGYSRTQAYRLLDVAKLIESVPGWETFGTLPVTALYQLAAPSTPVPVRDEVLDRLKAGERLSCAMVTEAIESAAAAAAREQNGAAPDATESADDAAESAEARKEFYADTDHAEHADDGGEDDHHHVGGDDHADDAGDDHRGGGDDHAEEPEPTPELKADLEMLTAVWEMSLPEERQGIRNAVLTDFFAQASGAHIAAFIPATKHAEVVRFLLDQLGVDGMLQAMSLEFGRRLRAKLPRKAKPFKTEHAVRTTDANGKSTYALKGRGSRSRPQA